MRPPTRPPSRWRRRCRRRRSTPRFSAAPSMAPRPARGCSMSAWTSRRAGSMPPLSLTASGYSPAALLATLGGELKLKASDGTLAGIALGDAGNIPEAGGADGAGRRAPPTFSRLDLVVAGKARHAAGDGGADDGAVRRGDPERQRRSARRQRRTCGSALLPAVVDPPEIGLRLSRAARPGSARPGTGRRWRAGAPSRRAARFPGPTGGGGA